MRVLPYKWNSQNGLLREASVALQGLPVLLADTSNTRERDHLVLQHKRPHPALGQARFHAPGATEPHRRGRLTPRPFNLVGNQASSGDEPQLSDVSSDRLFAPLLYGFHDPRFTRCDNSDIGGVPMLITHYRTIR